MKTSKTRASLSIICEIASAHGGSADSIQKLLSAANSTNADWVKIQIYNFDNLIARGNDNFSELKDIELHPKEWLNVIHYVATLRIRLIVEVFDFPSLRLIESEEAVDAYKIPNSDITHKDFVDAIFSQGKPVFVSIGGATLREIDAIVEHGSLFPNVELTLIHGIQSFPTRIEDSSLDKIHSLRERYDCAVGYADHVDAEYTEISRTIPAMAIAAGASVIEKHLTLDRSEKGYDYYSALNPTEFSEFVNHLRMLLPAIGSQGLENLTDAETTYRNKMKKFAVLSEPASKGTKVEKARVVYRRTEELGLTKNDVESKYFEKLLIKDLPADTVLNEDHFE